MASTSVNSKQWITNEEFSKFFRKECEKLNLVCWQCCDIYKDPYFINIQDCLHTFCRDCVDRVIRNKEWHNCPECHKLYNKEKLTYDPQKYSSILRLWNIYAAQYGIKGKNPYENTHQETAPWQETQNSPDAPQTSVSASSVEKTTHANQQIPILVSINALSLSNCTVERDTATNNDLTAKECTFLGKTFAIKNIHLVDTNFKQLKSETGEVSCITSPRFSECKGESIEAEKKVLLENVALTKNVISYNGEITARRSSMQFVRAEQSVTLKDSTASSIRSEGKATLENSKVEGPVFCRELVLNSSNIDCAEISFCSEKGATPIVNITLLGNSHINGNLYISPAEENQSQEPCIVEIQGKEKFSGRVIFKECTGKVL